MVSTNCDAGMIFLCQDKCSTNSVSRHNYLILGISNSQDKLGLIQAMSITSMRDKEVKMEVPIKLCNDMVSYIVPYNLHSFLSSDIDIRNYKGCLKDTDIISKNEFIKLLIDIYTDSIGIGNNHEEVISRYNKYCEDFWKEYGYCKEYRDCEKEVIQNIIEPEESYRKNKSSYEKRRNKSKKKFIKNKYEEKEIKRIMRESTGKVELGTDTEIENELTNIENPDLMNMKKFNHRPRTISSWVDNDLLDFIKGYKEFGFNQIHTVIPNRWTSPSSMSKLYTRCKDEAIRRKLNIGNI